MPQVGAAGAVCGIEALARWTHPELGQIAPDQFIAVAERSGLIAQLGREVARIACRDLVRLRKLGLQVPYMSVNVSALELADERYSAALLTMIAAEGLKPRDLELELTESAVMTARGTETQQLASLAAMGFRIAIDDFGTGYSSLARLQTLAVGKLKIDRSFVTSLGSAEGNTVLVETILTLAQRLGLQTVAEGVETAAQAEWLVAAGCAAMQGYYHARPMDIDVLLGWLRARAGAPAPAEGAAAELAQ
jgi:EAL domain-containing protein (putative c-di-GMP-specific phosphodiesterase class I)